MPSEAALSSTGLILVWPHVGTWKLHMGWVTFPSSVWEVRGTTLRALGKNSISSSLAWKVLDSLG